jgi:hypothetical protein
MMRGIHLNAVLAVALALYGVALFVAGVAVEIDWLRPFGIVGTVVGVVLGAFDKWLWKLPWLHPWFVETPSIGGTWKGQLTSSADGQIGETFRECYLVVRQRFSKVSAVLLTEESESKELTASIYRDSADGQTLAVTYENIPKRRYRDASPPNRGGMILHVRGDPPKQLDGEYFTSRRTVGEIEFDRRSGALADTFAEAARLFPGQEIRPDAR